MTQGAAAALVAHYGKAAVMNRRIHVSQEYGFVYVNNPKVACSTIKATLNLAVAARTGRTDFGFATLTQIHDRHHTLLARPREVGRAAFDAMMIDPGILRFTFTRDPVARFCSAYLDKLAGGAGSSRIAGRLWAYMGWPADKVLTLEAFAELCATDRSVLTMDPHWQPQRAQIAFDVVDYSFIGAQEQFALDFASVLERIFPGQGMQAVDTRTMFGHRSAARQALADLPDTVQQAVRRAYAADYDMLAEIAARRLNTHP